jgi:hypothetical protein
MATSEQDLNNRRQGQPITRADVRTEVRDAFSEFQQFTTNRNMTADQGGAQLMGENATLRAEKRALKDQVEDLERKVPPEGALVLKGDDVKAHNDLVALIPEGKKVEDLVAALKEGDKLSAKVKELERGNLIRDIAEAEGWKPSNLLKLTSGMDLALEEVEEEIDDPDNEGEKKKVQVKRGFIQTRDAQGNVQSKKKLGDELKDFLPSLKVEASQAESSEVAKGTAFVKQPVGSKADPKKAGKNVSQNYIGKAYQDPDKK